MKSRIRATLFCAVALLGARPAFVPADATESASCVAGLGDVYWNPAKRPLGPTYGAYNGRPIFEELMISRAEFAKGRSWQNIPIAVHGYAVDRE